MEGATVTLTDSAGKAVTTKVDIYGDFEIDGLEAPTTHTLKIELARYYLQT